MSTVTMLECINSVLQVVAQHPVSSPDSNHPIAVEAKAVVTRKLREILQKGWWFNTDYNFVLATDTAGHIIVPENAVSVIPTDGSIVVRRGGKLYDPVNHTYEFSDSITCNIVRELDVADLPPAAAEFLIADARYTHFLNKDGEQDKLTELRGIAQQARATFRQEHIRQLKVSVNTNETVLRLRSRSYGARSTAVKIDYVR